MYNCCRYVDRDTAFRLNLSYVEPDGTVVMKADNTTRLERGQHRNRLVFVYLSWANPPDFPPQCEDRDTEIIHTWTLHPRFEEGALGLWYDPSLSGHPCPLTNRISIHRCMASVLDHKCQLANRKSPSH